MIIFINILTTLRIFLGSIIFIIIAFDMNTLLALLLFMIAGLTDYFDGFLARKYNKTSIIGEILDPIADKILIIFILFGLAINFSSYLIGFAASLIISREIWVSALRDFNSRIKNESATKVTFLAKTKTSIQLFTILIYLFGLAINNMIIIVFADIFMIIAVLITLYTGYEYTLKTYQSDILNSDDRL